MSITDELRKWGRATLADTSLLVRMEAIADRIDAEHEQQMRERKGCIHYDQERHYCNVHDLTTEDYKRGFDDGFASADDWLAQHEDAMAEHGWIRLPKDADGEPIHVGDVMEYTDSPTEPLTVSHIDLEKNGWWVFAGGIGRRPDKCRQHHAPTVEDVLREFGIDWEHESDCEDRAALLKEYASKLRLAEGEDA